MTLEIVKSQKRNFQIFQLKGMLTVQSCFTVKNNLEDTLKNFPYNICLGLRDLTEIDSTGIRLIENFHKLMGQSSRKLVLMETKEPIQQKIYSKLNRELVLHFDDIAHFESIFVEESGDLKKKYLNIASKEGALNTLNLICPLCTSSGIIGRLCDEETLQMEWVDSDITPQWVSKNKEDIDLEFDLYEVSVCPNCYFASPKIEHFKVRAESETLPSFLKKEQQEKLIKNAVQRTRVLNDEQRERGKSFFTSPLDPQAGYVSWKLYDRVLRDLAKDRSQIDCLEVARANILAAKFGPTPEDRNQALTTAQAWLFEMLNHPEVHVSSELAMGFVYLVSTNLALENVNEASRLAQQYFDKFGKEDHLDFWSHRIRYLMED